jgi:hypothetical protein
MGGGGGGGWQRKKHAGLFYLYFFPVFYLVEWWEELQVGSLLRVPGSWTSSAPCRCTALLSATRIGLLEPWRTRPEMEVTEIISGKVSGLCQLSSHSSRLYFKSLGPSLKISLAYKTHPMIQNCFDKKAFVKFKISNNFKQYIDETHSKQPKIQRKSHTSLWILKIARKNPQTKSLETFAKCLWFFVISISGGQPCEVVGSYWNPLKEEISCPHTFPYRPVLVTTFTEDLLVSLPGLTVHGQNIKYSEKKLIIIIFWQLLTSFWPPAAQ